MRTTRRTLAVFAFAACIGGCVSTDRAGPDDAAQRKWAATGWLNPGRAGDPEIIGVFETRGECDAAVNDWLARQVVGNPIDAECLPIDRW